MDFLQGTPCQTTNTDLAAALCTLGIPRNAEQPLQVLVGEVERVAFFFEEFSTCGTYKTGESIGMWDSTRLDEDRPQHALTYMRCALRSRARLLEYTHRSSRIGVARRPGGRFEVVKLEGLPQNKDAVPAPRVPSPDSATTPRLQTDDLDLAASLLACGIPMWRDMPIERTAPGRVAFFFQPISPCGSFNARELILAWQDHGWHERHPEHPFAYLWCVFENRRRLMREIKNKVPTVCFLRAGYPQFLTLNADPHTEKTFMTALNAL
jgi:hypothetical protein